MHVSDGFLEVPVIAATTVASVGILSVVAKRTPAAELTSPMVGASAAFVIAAQMVNFPVASSVSGHIIGGVLVAILLGWRVSVLVMTAVLVIQAMLFQDGGIAALGANVLNLAIVGPGLGYLVYLGIRGRIVEGRERAWTYRDSVAAFLAGWTASVVAALKADHHVGPLRQPVDNAPLAFIAPLGANNCGDWHGSSLYSSLALRGVADTSRK